MRTTIVCKWFKKKLKNKTNKPSAFSSYAGIDKHYVESVNTRLKRAGINTYYSKNIVHSSIWRNELVNKIQSNDIFIALLTNDYHKGNYTDHEFGIAIASKRKIISVMSKNCPRYGFIDHYQVLEPDMDYRTKVL